MFVKGMKESLRAKLISLEDFESMTLATVQERLKQLEASDSVETSAHLSALTDSLDTREDLIRQGWVPPNGKKPFQKRTQNKILAVIRRRNGASKTQILKRVILLRFGNRDNPTSGTEFLPANIRIITIRIL